VPPAAPDAEPHPTRMAWLPWRAGYRARDARDDVLAGSTLAAYAVPSSIAYAQLAGMPVQTGLYCYLFAGVAYAVAGTSRQLAVGPTSSIAPSRSAASLRATRAATPSSPPLPHSSWGSSHCSPR